MNASNVTRDDHTTITDLGSLQLLNATYEERFGHLTRLAKRLFNIPIAIVNLAVDNPHWFHDQCPVGEENKAKFSFCGNTIRGDEVLIVNDATKDPRFQQNPLVIEKPNIRFFMGCPLRGLDGSNVGTLCLFDTRRRRFSEDDIATFKDLAQLAEREVMAVHLATLDDLTQIANRRGFITLAENNLNLCKRLGRPATIAFLDLNHFKQINDRFGHAMGDHVLKVFAQYLLTIFRDSDIVARLSGDEFAVFFPDTDLSTAKENINRLQHAISKYNKKSTHHYTISFSEGLAAINTQIEQSIETLLQQADLLMYEKKHARVN